MIVNPKPGAHRLLAHGIVEWLRTAIREQSIRPGEWLRLKKIAEHFGVSQTPVREALKILREQGLVENLPNRGMRVVEVSAEDAQDLFGCRMVLEGHAARLAAENMTDDELQRLADLRQKISVAVDEENTVEYQELNQRLHFMIIDGSRQTTLRQTVFGLWSAFPMMLWSNFRESTRNQLERRFAEDADEHERIVDALARRNPDAAEVAMRSHLERSLDSLLATL